MKEEKGKTAGDKKVLNPALETRQSHTIEYNEYKPSSFHRDTDSGIKVLENCEVLQRGSTYVCQYATKAPCVTRTGTYGPGARFSNSRNVKKWSSTHETESK